MQPFVQFLLGQEVDVKSSFSKNGRSSESGDASPGAGQSSGPARSWFSLVVVLALIGLWSSMAVVYFDVVDYDSVLARAKEFRQNFTNVLQGKLSAYDSDGDGDFDLEDAKVLLDETRPGPNSTERSLRGVRLRSALKQELRDLHRAMEAKRLTEILLTAFREALKDEKEEQRRERGEGRQGERRRTGGEREQTADKPIQREEIPEEIDEKFESPGKGKTRRHFLEKQQKTVTMEKEKKDNGTREETRKIQMDKGQSQVTREGTFKRVEHEEVGKLFKETEKMKAQEKEMGKVKDKIKMTVSEKGQIMRSKRADEERESIKLKEKDRLTKETEVKEKAEKEQASQIKDTLQQKQLKMPESLIKMKLAEEERTVKGKEEKPIKADVRAKTQQEIKGSLTKDTIKMDQIDHKIIKEQVAKIIVEERKFAAEKERKDEQKQRELDKRGKETEEKNKIAELKEKEAKVQVERRQSDKMEKERVAKEEAKNIDAEREQEKEKIVGQKIEVKQAELKESTEQNIKLEHETRERAEKDRIEISLASKKQEEILKKQMEEEMMAREVSVKLEQERIKKPQIEAKVKATLERQKSDKQNGTDIKKEKIELEKKVEIEKGEREQLKINKQAEDERETTKEQMAKRISERVLKSEKQKQEMAEEKIAQDLMDQHKIENERLQQRPVLKMPTSKENAQMEQQIRAKLPHKHTEATQKIATEQVTKLERADAEKVQAEKELAAKKQLEKVEKDKIEQDQIKKAEAEKESEVIAVKEVLAKENSEMEPKKMIQKTGSEAGKAGKVLETKLRIPEAQSQIGQKMVTFTDEKLKMKMAEGDGLTRQKEMVKKIIGEREVKEQNATKDVKLQQAEKGRDKTGILRPAEAAVTKSTTVKTAQDQGHVTKEQNAAKLVPKAENEQTRAAILGQAKRVVSPAQTVKKIEELVPIVTKEELKYKQTEPEVSKLQTQKAAILGQPERIVTKAPLLKTIVGQGQVMKLQKANQVNLQKPLIQQERVTSGQTEKVQTKAAILEQAGNIVAQTTTVKKVGQEQLVREHDATKLNLKKDQIQQGKTVTLQQTESVQTKVSFLGQAGKVVKPPMVKKLTGQEQLVKDQNATKLVTKAVNEQIQQEKMKLQQPKEDILGQAKKVVTPGQMVKSQMDEERLVKDTSAETRTRAEAKQATPDIWGQAGRVVNKEQEIKKILAKEPVVRAETIPMKPAILGQAGRVVAQRVSEQQKQAAAATGARPEAKQATSAILGQAGRVVAKEQEVKKFVAKEPVVRAETIPMKPAILGQAGGVVAQRVSEQQKQAAAATGARPEAKQATSAILGQAGRVVAKEQEVKKFVAKEPVVRAETIPMKPAILGQAGGVVAQRVSEQQKQAAAATGARPEAKQATSAILGQAGRVVAKEQEVKMFVAKEPVVRAEIKPMKSAILGQAGGVVAKEQEVKKIVGKEPVVSAETIPMKSAILGQAGGVAAQRVSEQQKQAAADMGTRPEAKQATSAILGQAGRVVTKGEEIKKIVGKEPVVGAGTKPMKLAILGQAGGVVAKGVSEQQKQAAADTGTKAEVKQATSAILGPAGRVVADLEAKKIVAKEPLVRAETIPKKSAILGQAGGVVAQRVSEQPKQAAAATGARPEAKQATSAILGQAGRVVAKEQEVKKFIAKEPVVRAEIKSMKSAILGQAGRVVAKGMSEQQNVDKIAKTKAEQESLIKLQSVKEQTKMDALKLAPKDNVKKQMVETIVESQQAVKSQQPDKGQPKADILKQAQKEVTKAQPVKMIVGQEINQKVQVINNKPQKEMTKEFTTYKERDAKVGATITTIGETQVVKEREQIKAGILGLAKKEASKEQPSKTIVGVRTVMVQEKPNSTKLLSKTKIEPTGQGQMGKRQDAINERGTAAILGLAKGQTVKKMVEQEQMVKLYQGGKDQTKADILKPIGKEIVNKMIGQNKQNATKPVSKVQLSEQVQGAVKEQEKADILGKGEKIVAKGPVVMVHSKSKSEMVKLRQTEKDRLVREMTAILEKQPEKEVTKKQVVQKVITQEQLKVEKVPAKAAILKQIKSK
ncbi:trichohyalin isoform X2 [Periophthalmus magnuspinnatus]|uniref:trichohyalin isoform X2 n=1 Tax=Periophthalmus magnuspinnatus TaxID=409849 RepID=UPI002436A338|nr:trichohyalin isoform X2 [Periophthalmus magnuspinnatus]